MRRIPVHCWTCVGRINDLSVSPDGKLWLVTALSHTYYSDGPVNEWHYGPTLYKTRDSLSSFNGPHLDRISFFNRDTAIITGYIQSDTSEEYSSKNGYFRTTDAGKSWQLRTFGDDQWIYDVFTTPEGKAWMGGSDGKILYSADFGKTWAKLNSPYNSLSRMARIYMQDERRGVAGALGNKLYTTSNNWKTYSRIPTPLDQKKYRIPNDEDYHDDRIDNLAVWGNRIVVAQQGHIFYTEQNTIEWKAFPQAISQFALDASDGKLYGITEGNTIIMFTAPDKWNAFTAGKLEAGVLNMKAVAGNVYVLDRADEVHKANDHFYAHSPLFTSDRPIPTLEIIRQGVNIRWGVTGNQIYLSSRDGDKWRRETSLPFDVTDFHLRDDSTALLWDGVQSHVYRLHSHQASSYVYGHPLAEFLRSPVRSFSVVSGTRGCFHFREDLALYAAKSDGQFEMRQYLKDRDEQEIAKVPPGVHQRALADILSSISDEPDYMPSITDFKITASDMDSFRQTIKRLTAKKREIRISGPGYAPRLSEVFSYASGYYLRSYHQRHADKAQSYVEHHQQLAGHLLSQRRRRYADRE